MVDVNAVCEELKAFQKEYKSCMRSRIMLENRLRAKIAETVGLDPKSTEAYDEAQRVIDAVVAGEIKHEQEFMILAITPSIQLFDDQEKEIKKKMEKLAKSLPVAEWVSKPEQAGFGLPSLATLVGEAGNLSNYASPAKLWKRFSMHPHKKNGKSHMGHTWNTGKYGNLTANEWEEYGYVPQRRSISYLWGQNIKMKNKSIYRQRFEDKKAEYQQLHPEYPKGQCDRHGRLLAAKLLVKNLWIEWRKHEVVAAV